MTWLKRRWVWLLGGLVAVGGLVVAILTLGQVRPKPKRPDTPDVEIPDAPTLDTTPADDYETEKEEPKADGDEVMDDINRRYS